MRIITIMYFKVNAWSWVLYSTLPLSRSMISLQPRLGSRKVLENLRNLGKSLQCEITECYKLLLHRQIIPYVRSYLWWKQVWMVLYILILTLYSQNS